ALTRFPYVVSKPCDRSRVTPHFDERPHERRDALSGEGRKRQPHDMGLTLKLFEREPQPGRVGDLFLSSRHDEEYPQLANTAAEKREQTQTHLISPVEVFEREHQCSVGGERRDELRHALEQSRAI